MYRLIQEGTNRYGQFDVARLTREQAERLKRYEEEMATERTRIGAAASRDVAGIGAAATRYSADREITLRKAAYFDTVYDDLRKNASLDPEYMRLFATNPNDANGYLQDRAYAAVNRVFGGGGGGGGNVDLGGY
jgi:hypothetical protein